MVPASLLVLGVAPSAHAVDGTWNVDSAGNWSLNTNWTSNPSIPGGAGSTVNLTFNITANRIITIDTTSRTVGFLNIGDPTSEGGTPTFKQYSLNSSGGASLIMDGNGVDAQITHVAATGSGSDIINAGVLLNSNLKTNTAGTLQLTLAGNISSNTSGTKIISNVGGGSGNFKITGIIGDGGGAVAVVQNSGTSALNLTGANTFTGGITLTSGKLLATPGANEAVGTQGALGASGDITFNGGTLQFGANSIANGGTIGDYSTRFRTSGANAIILDLGGKDITLGGGIVSSNVNGLNMTTASAGGSMTLNGTNSYSGGTIFNGGSAASTLNIGNVNALGSGTLTFVRGTLDNTSGSPMTLTNTVRMDGDISFAGSNNLTFTSDGALGVSGAGHAGTTQDFAIATGTLTVNGVLSDSGGTTSFNKSGAGTLVLTGVNTFTGGLGAVGIGNGVVSVGSIGSSTTDGGLGRSNSTINLGGTTTTGQLTYTGGGETSTRLIKMGGATPGTGGGIIDQSGTGLLKFTSNGNIQNAGTAGTDQRKTLTLQGSTAGTGEFSGVLSDAAAGTAGQTALSVAKLGTGTWTLSGVNTYSGGTSVSGGGTLKASTTASPLGSGSVVVDGSGTVLELDIKTSIADTATLTVQNGGKLGLNFGSGNTENIAILKLDGTIFATDTTFTQSSGFVVNGVSYASYFTNTSDAGTSLHVIPEPGSVSLVACVGVFSALRRRRRSVSC